MARCRYCHRFHLLLRTDSRGLCKNCRSQICSDAVAVEKEIKRDLVAAKIFEDPGLRVKHLQHALGEANKLFQYDRFGCCPPSLSPQEIRRVLKERLREATSG